MIDPNAGYLNQYWLQYEKICPKMLNASTPNVHHGNTAGSECSLNMVALTVLLKCTLAFLNDMIAISPSHIFYVGSFRQMTHGSTGLIPVVCRTPFQGEKKGGGFPFSKLYFEEYHLKFERIWF